MNDKLYELLSVAFIVAGITLYFVGNNRRTSGANSVSGHRSKQQHHPHQEE